MSDVIRDLSRNNGLCIECNERHGYVILGGSCTRCARDNRLFLLRELADQHELAWSDYCDVIYRVEVYEGVRIPPSRVPAHDAQGDPVMGLSSTDDEGRFSTPMKQARTRRPTIEDDEEMTDDPE